MSAVAEKRHMSRVAELGCYLCDLHGVIGEPAQLHHIREGRGLAQRATNWLVVPLCDRHHANSSPDGIHGQRRAWRLAHVDEMDALAWVIERLSNAR